MDNDFTMPESAEVYTKFGHKYRVFTSEKYKFPVFCDETELNSVIYEFAELCRKYNAVMNVKTVYADSRWISLLMNDKIYLNYSIETGMLLPPDFVLKLTRIKKRDIKRACKMAGKRIRALSDTVRFTQGGIKIDAVAKDKESKVTLKLTSDKKSRKISKQS